MKNHLSHIPRTARFIAAVLIFAAAPMLALADDPVNGATLFAKDCTGSNCHGTTPLTSNQNKIYFGRNARSVPDAAISNVGDMNSLRTAYPAGGTALADIAAYLGNSPATLTFGSTSVGSTSATQTVTVSASLKSSANAISGLSVATTGDFARSGGTCGTAVAFGTSCTVLVAFTPTASGSRTGTLSISHAKTLTPVPIALSGTGGGAVTAPIANITPASLTLASTTVGSTSAAQQITVSNSGNAALSITSITSSNTPEFLIAGGTCAAPGSVAAGSSCTVSVAFKPSATGARGGTLNIAHNAAGSPGNISLAGTGTAAAAPLASLAPTGLSYGSLTVGSTSAAQSVTLSNTGTAPLVLGALGTGSTEFGITGGTCSAGASIAAGTSCSVSAVFTPGATGARSASLSISHNAAGSPSTASLAGTGVAASPVASLSPTTLSFSQTTGTTSTAQNITVSNTGTAPLTLSAITLGGAQAAEYQIAAGSTCAAGTSVAASSSCLLKVTFVPTATGARSASLSITHNAAGSPSAVALNGTGTATPQPAISLNQTLLTFNSQALGSTSAAQTVTLSNSGAATLTLSGLTLTGTTAADFTRSGTCTASSSLAIGSSCTVSFSFTPGATGARSATLTIASDASNGSAVLSLAGTGAAAPAPAVTLTPTTLAFGAQTIGVTSTVRTATLANSGSAALAISGITAAAPYAVSHNCPASLAAAASCGLSVTFTPTATGAAAGNVTVASNAAGSPQLLTLTGSGAVASPALAWVPAATSLSFADATLGATPITKTLTLTNQGPGASTLSQFTLAGAQASEFSVAPGGSCTIGMTLAQGATCTLVLGFQPAAAGARAATLHVASSGTNPPDLALSGNGTASSQASLIAAPTALTFSAPDAQMLMVQSNGSAVLHVNSIAVATGPFTAAPASINGCPNGGFDLMPGQNCAVAVAWSGTNPATDTGTLAIDSNASATPMKVALQAQSGGAAAPLTATNIGGSGCSIARGDSITDPTLWLLTLLAIATLWWRRKRR